MNSLPKLIGSGSPERLPSTLPLSVLASLETQALKIEYAVLCRQSAVQDAWYLSCDDQTIGPETFAQILQRLVSGQSSVAILHESAVREEEPRWRYITYRAWCLNPLTSTAWIVGFWTLAVMLGWVLVYMSLPQFLRGYGEAAYGLSLLAFATALVIRGLRSKLPKLHKTSPQNDEASLGS